jgi:glucose-1-phosphate thymidylyltransferase
MRCSSDGSLKPTGRRAPNFARCGQGGWQTFHAGRFSTGSANVRGALVRWVTMNIAKAVVLAADSRNPEPWPGLGLSTRHLAPVANKPVLFHHLEALSAAGIGETAIVCDRRSNAAVREAVGDGSSWGLDVRYFEESPLDGILASAAVADFVGYEPVLVQHGDILLDEDLSTLDAQFADYELDALVMHAGHWSRRKDDRGRSIDGYLIGPGVFPDLRRQGAGLGDALARLQATGARIQERYVEAWLPCRGGTDALLAANRRMLEAMPVDQCGERIFDSEIQGRLALDPSAEVRDSLIRGPVAIGPGARIANAYIGPYTSIGADVQIDSVEIEHSIILDRAQLRFVGFRLEGSLVGPDARVTRDFRLPQAIRLSVGAGAKVALS